jgi:Winged helix DNA-binding domain
VAERTLGQRDLNRALLARQLLLARVRLPLPRVLERIGGIQNQYAPNGYIRLFSCVEGFRRDDLTRALERRTVVQATLMRQTIHLVSRRDYWRFAVAVRASHREWLLRVRKPRPDERELERTAGELRAALADGPRSYDELNEITEGRWHDAGPWVELVRVPPSGTWAKRRAHLFETAEAWVGPETGTTEDALEHLVRRYLGAFGPARPEDVAKWAGTNVRDVAPALERLRLRRFRDTEGKELLDVPRAPLPDPDTPAPVRFLPTWDAILLVHARRSGVLPEEYRSLVFNVKTPHSVGTFLVDGAVAGTWRFERGRIRTEPFARLDRAAAREVAEEAERLAVLHGETG